MAKIINFTKAAIESLPTPQKNERIEYQDAKNSSLVLRHYGTGRKTFCVLRRIKRGGLKRITIGTFPAVSPDAARSKAIELIAKLEAGRDPTDEFRKQKSALTLDQVFSLYIEGESKPKKKTWQQDIGRYTHHIKPTLGKRKAAEVSRSEIVALHAKLSIGLSGATANRVLALLSAIFNWAIRIELLEQNPAQHVRKNREFSRDRFVTRDELPYLFAALEAEPNSTIRDFVKIALYTGARCTNVLEMRFSDISWTEAIWRIPETKNGTPQNVALVDSALEILLARQASIRGAWVFPGEGATGHMSDPHKGWRRVIKRATNLRLLGALKGLAEALPLVTEGQVLADEKQPLRTLEKLARLHRIDSKTYDMTDLRIHDLRRTLGSWQVMTGSSLPIVGKSLNHKNPSSTAVYARLDLDPVRASLERATKEMLSTNAHERSIKQSSAA